MYKRQLPMILPPTVLGYYLILLVGRRGVIGPWLAECGINLIFSWPGAVVAATVVVFPLIYKMCIRDSSQCCGREPCMDNYGTCLYKLIADF